MRSAGGTPPRCPPPPPSPSPSPTLARVLPGSRTPQLSAQDQAPDATGGVVASCACRARPL
eukprot:555524-Prymnesium_polylepis.1